MNILQFKIPLNDDLNVTQVGSKRNGPEKKHIMNFAYYDTVVAQGRIAFAFRNLLMQPR